MSLASLRTASGPSVTPPSVNPQRKSNPQTPIQIVEMRLIANQHVTRIVGADLLREGLKRNLRANPGDVANGYADRFQKYRTKVFFFNFSSHCFSMRARSSTSSVFSI